MKKYLKTLGALLLAAATLSLTACGGSDSESYDNSESSYQSESGGDEETVTPVNFNSAEDVYQYLNLKSFRADDGLTLKFGNAGRSLYLNGDNISNNISIYDIGMNDNGVSYATVRILTMRDTSITLTLLAVQGHAQLIDPNDGTVYEY